MINNRIIFAIIMSSIIFGQNLSEKPRKPFMNTDDISFLGTSNRITSILDEAKQFLSDAIIALPGGVGTWEELFEALAWNQLGINSKPIVLFNVDNYYSKLFEFTEFSVNEGFLPESTKDELFISDSLSNVFNFINSFKERDTQDWFNKLGR